MPGGCGNWNLSIVHSMSMSRSNWNGTIVSMLKKWCIREVVM